MNVTAQAIEKITSLTITEMVKEAALRGSTVTAAEIVNAVVSDPSGETAQYFNAAVIGGVKWYLDFKNSPELLAAF